MMKTNYFQLLFFVLVVSAFLATAQEVDDEKEFSYEKDSKNGPAHWGEIQPDWKNCSSGKMQSPIDIVNKRVQVVSDLGTFDKAYKSANVVVINRGHDIMLTWGSGAGYIKINGTKYQLMQSHWHSPSEHTVNGNKLDMEVHLVHQNKQNRTAVVAILYKIGQPDSFLSMMGSNLEAISKSRDVKKELGKIDPNLIKSSSRKYYRYIGSLTTPPCTENVIWTILGGVRTVSREQVKLIREAIHDEAEANARQIQPVNNRTVKLYRTTNRF